MTGHIEVVTLALYLLGGHERAIDTEDVAKKAHELAPGRFSWKKYPDQINLEMVRVSLSDAKKAANGSLTDGSGRTGWSLTAAGIKWAAAAVKNLPERDLSLGRPEGRGGGTEERRWRAERARLMAHPAWTRWKNGERLTLREAREVFRLDAYTVGQLETRKISRLTSIFVGDEELESFLEAAARALGNSSSGS